MEPSSTNHLPEAEYLPRRSVAAGAATAAGRSLRDDNPLERHAIWSEPEGRCPSPIEVLDRQAARRTPELVPIRYGRMAASPFAFFRAARRSWPQIWPALPVAGLVAQL